MKLVGVISIILGSILLILVIVQLSKGVVNPVSPIPETNGVKVIFITPKP